MSLIPTFELGVLNAWIFMLIHSLPQPVMMILKSDNMKELPVSNSGFEKKYGTFMWILYLIIVIYSIFLPLKWDSFWFYSGLMITTIGVILYVIVIYTFFVTPLKAQCFDSGLYRYSRHPMYVTQIPLFCGIALFSASWLFFVLSFIYIFLSFRFALYEEEACLIKYGDQYKAYTEKTPRWIGFPNSFNNPGV